MKNVILFLFASLLACAAEAQERWGLVNVSVCNTRSDADYNAGMETQGLLGMPVQILANEQEWSKVCTPDGYESWTLTGCLTECSRQELTDWNKGKQIVVTALYAQCFQRPSVKSQPVSDLVACNRLRLLGKRGAFYHVAFPDGREGYVSKHDAMPLERWRASLNLSHEAILATAHRLMGLPYMWGGMSPKGVDCSGFVRTVLYMHDIIIPRNASQMAREGERLEIETHCANLLPGDLLFFGNRETGRVLHVAFYLGNQQFIHSLGRVRLASFNPADELYDAYDHDRLLFAARILPYVNQRPNLFTTDKSPFYQ